MGSIDYMSCYCFALSDIISSQIHMPLDSLFSINHTIKTLCTRAYYKTVRSHGRIVRDRQETMVSSCFTADPSPRDLLSALGN